MKTNAKLVLTIVITITLLAGCGGDDPSGPETTTGAVEVTTQTTGPDPDDYDDDGYTVNVDGANSQPADSSDTVVIDGLKEGTHNVELTGVAETCAVESDNPQVVEVTAGETASVTFEVSCSAIIKSKIVYTGGEGLESDLYLMNPDGTEVEQFANTRGRKLYADISPDGSQVVYSQGGNLITVTADGKETELLTTTNNYYEPAWSPDGKKIAFVQYMDSNYEIFVMNADGSEQTQLTTHAEEDRHPSWSPDGSTLAFHSDRSGNYDIYTIDPAGGTAPRKLTDTRGDEELYPEWSPGGSKIAFGIDSRLYVMDADGGNTELLFSDESLDSIMELSWSPDGARIALQANSQNEDGSYDWEIYQVNADGSGMPINLTQNKTDDMYPDWSPVGQN